MPPCSRLGVTTIPEADDCAREPIRIPGAIQPHGVLLIVAAADQSVLQYSTNCTAVLGCPITSGENIAPLLGLRLTEELTAWAGGDDPVFRRIVTIKDRRFQLIAQRSVQGIILELEPHDQAEHETLDDLYPLLQLFLERIAEINDPIAACEAATQHVRRLTRFNRVLIYRFNEGWNGTVIAEDRDDTLPSYLDLRFPATDIPAQARELYRANRLRLIPDVNYTPSPLEPALSPTDGAPLDLGCAALRSVSPVHLEYMRNMGTAASMSVSLVIDGRLWGLIACHHASPRFVGPAARTVCDTIGQFLAQHIGARERMVEAAQRIALKRIETGLLARLARADSFQRGLIDNAGSWLSLMHASGAAVLTQDGLHTVGQTPHPEDIRAIAGWLGEQNFPPVFATDQLAERFPGAATYAEVASGLLALSISNLHKSYIIWFRPEMIQAVTWAGDPRAAKEERHEKLHPRRSFERWQELVRMQAEPWTRAEIDGAGDFRNSILEFVLRRAEERAELTDELQRSNKELESFSYSVSHDLRAPFRHIVGYAELLAERASNLDDRSRHFLDSIVEAALSAGRLVDDLLNFSQLNRATLANYRVDMDKLVVEARRTLEHEAEGRDIEWRVDQLPQARGDPSLLRQVLFNLLSNAVKYTRGRARAIIEVSGEDRELETVYSIRDNGTGFDMAYVGKLFGVFQRLHRAEEFEGTGIGLALTKRVIDRHGGRIDAHGVVNEGAVFTFSLPR